MITLHNVLHVPNADTRYFSITVLLEKGGKIIFKDKGFTILVGNRDLVVEYMECHLFWFDASIDSSLALHTHITASMDIEIWHHWMGHMSYQALKWYSNSVKEMKFDGLINHDHSLPCASCELGKQVQLPFSLSSKCLNQWLQVVHSNLAGLMQV